MKKALIVIISAIYIVAIIIVSFLGARAEISNRITYAKEIVLLNENTYYLDKPKEEENIDIAVYQRPDEEFFDQETGYGYIDEFQWNYNNNQRKRDYLIYVYDTNFLYDTMGKIYTLYTSVRPDNTTKKDLEYIIDGGDKVTKTLSIDGDKGKIHFSEEYTSAVDVDILVKTTDQSYIEIDIWLRIAKYKKD